MNGADVALITAPRTPQPWHDYELPLIEGALRDAGIQFETVAWYHDIDWSTYTLAVLRSPWDLYWHLEDFHAWLRHVETQTIMFNPAPAVAWNLDKRYLGELARQDLPVVPTLFVEPRQPLPGVEWSRFVVKPTTSAGALNSAMYSGGLTAEVSTHVTALHELGLGAMIQPYIDEIENSGEHALIFYNGRFDHAIRKGHVIKAGESYTAVRDSHPSPVPYTPSETELELAEAALALAPGGDSLLHARVDIVSDGVRPLLMELELVDPVLFFGTSQDSAQRYASAIGQRLGSLSPSAGSWLKSGRPHSVTAND